MKTLIHAARVRGVIPAVAVIPLCILWQLALADRIFFLPLNVGVRLETQPLVQVLWSAPVLISLHHRLLELEPRNLRTWRLRWSVATLLLLLSIDAARALDARLLETHDSWSIRNICILVTVAAITQRVSDSNAAAFVMILLQAAIITLGKSGAGEIAAWCIFIQGSSPKADVLALVAALATLALVTKPFHAGRARPRAC